MVRTGDINPKVWGRRPYADKDAREVLNDVSTWIARTRPDGVDDPDDPSLSDILRYAGHALDSKGTDEPKTTTLSALMGRGLDYQEAVVWYWFRYCELDLTEIHYATTGRDRGGDPATRRNATRNIVSVLKSAARKLDDVDPDSVPDVVEDTEE